MFPSKYTNKTMVKLLAVLALGITLTACGEDKQTKPEAQTATKTEEKAPQAKVDSAKPAEDAQSDDKKADDKKPDEKQADEKPAQSDDKKAKNKEALKADDKKADEQKPDAKKAEEKTDSKPVKALSIEEGKKRYETTCKACHDQGLLDAPKLTDKANWAKRLEQGADTLHAHSAKGFNKMPAQATADVSEAEVYAAVDYIISQVK